MTVRLTDWLMTDRLTDWLMTDRLTDWLAALTVCCSITYAPAALTACAQAPVIVKMQFVNTSTCEALKLEVQH